MIIRLYYSPSTPEGTAKQLPLKFGEDEYGPYLEFRDPLPLTALPPAVNRFLCSDAAPRAIEMVRIIDQGVDHAPLLGMYEREGMYALVDTLAPGNNVPATAWRLTIRGTNYIQTMQFYIDLRSKPAHAMAIAAVHQVELSGPSWQHVQ